MWNTFQMLLTRVPTERLKCTAFSKASRHPYGSKDGIPISHVLLVSPKNNKPYLPFSPIRGPQDDKMVRNYWSSKAYEKTLTQGNSTQGLHEGTPRVRC